MLKKSGLVAIVAMMLVFGFMPVGASAALFQFSYTNPTDGTLIANGLLTANLSSGNEYDIVGISGFRDTETIGSLVTGSGTTPSGLWYFDNKLSSPSSTPLTLNGFVFTIGTTEYNIYYYNGLFHEFSGYYIPGTGSGFLVDTVINFNVAPVPIPAAAWLLGTGLVGLVALKRRQK